ncbi:hypothetical protein LBWT_X0010 (plasmid) [Leptolyngbya boryana IAM M-101]|nr:hypothetical protein LBWT_X0010 [Leptolyngbya boryana IAM M-101]BAS66277.1 hypothetical protein LBDG_X0010 [Leptolyngbya boryana dg5]
MCERQTEWSSALPEMTEEVATPQPEAPQPAAVPQSSHPTPRYGAMTVAEGWAKSRHKYAGKDFKIMDDESVQCPAGHRMSRREIRYTRRGDMQMLFSMNPRICASCPVKQHCLSDDSKNTNGRRISVIRTKLPPVPTVAVEPEITIIAQAPMKTVQGTQALIWTDIPATQLRREIRQHLRRHQSRIEQSNSAIQTIEPAISYLTRSQRAHRRLAWAERLKRNAARSNTLQISVEIFGVSPKLIEFLNCLSDKRSESS